MKTTMTQPESPGMETGPAPARKSMASDSVLSQLREGKNAVMDAIDTRVHTARRAARKARFATEDLMDTAAVQLRRRPFRSVGVAFVAGAAIGLIAQRLFSRGARNGA